MPRPTDWSPLGLQGDPTPGDPEALVAVADFMHAMAANADTARTGLEQVVSSTGDGAFVGKTADWLRDTVSTAIRDFIGGVSDAFGQTEPAVRSYIVTLREAQSRADQALGEAAGLAADDTSRRATLADDATRAGSDLTTAARSAAGTIRSARDHIHSPNPKKSACERFWEIFGWIVLAISVVAIFTGGPIGLIALGLGAIMAVKAVVDFVEGKTNIAGLLLGLLGMLGPSTKPLIALSTLKSIASATAKVIKDGLRSVGTSVAKIGAGFWEIASTMNVRAVVAGVVDIATTVASTIRDGGLWVFRAFTTADGLAVRGVITLRDFVVSAPAASVDLLRSIAKAGGTLPAALATSVQAIPGFARDVVDLAGRGLRAVPRVLSNEFGQWKWLKIFLPLDGTEIGVLGVHDAFRLAVLGRGLARTGHYAGLVDQVKLAQLAGGSLRVSDGILHGVNPPESGLTHTESGLLVPHPEAGVSAVQTHLGDGVSAAQLTEGAGLAAGHTLAPHAGALATGLPATTALPHGMSLAANLGSAPAAHPGGLVTAGGDLAQVSVTGAHSGLGDLSSPARLATHHAGDLPATGLPELRAALGGDITAVKLTDSRVAFNLGAGDDGRIVIGSGAVNLPAASSVSTSVSSSAIGGLGGVGHGGQLATAHPSAAGASHADLSGATHLTPDPLTPGHLTPGHHIPGSLTPGGAVHDAAGSVSLPGSASARASAHPPTTVVADAGAGSAAPTSVAGSGALLGTRAATAGPVPSDAPVELIIGAGGVEIRGQAAAPSPLTSGGGRGVPTDQVGGAAPLGRETASGGTAQAGGLVSRGGPAGQSTRDALALLAVPPPSAGRSAVTAVPDGVSARLTEPSGAGIRGPQSRLDTAGVSTARSSQAALSPAVVRPDPETAGAASSVPLAEHAEQAGGHGLDAAFDAVVRNTAAVRNAREHLAAAPFTSAASPAEKALNVARAERSLRAAESFHQRTIADLQARGVSDPVAAAGEHAWAQFRIAETRLAEARADYQVLHPGTRPLGAQASPAAKGKPSGTSAQLASESRLRDALAGFTAAEHRLHDLELDVSRLRAADNEALRLSLIEHPRLPGGARRPESLANLPLSDGLRFESTNPGELWGRLAGQPNGRSLEGPITYPGHGGFRVTDQQNPARFREYDDEGALVAYGGGIDLVGPQGPHSPRSPHGRLDVDAAPATLHLPGGESRQVDYVPDNGSHLITSLGGDGTQWRFGEDGALTGFVMPARNVPWAPDSRFEVNMADESATLRRAGDDIQDFGYEWRDGAHWFMGANDAWLRFGEDGGLTGFEMPVRNLPGVAAGRLEVDFTGQEPRAWLHRDGVRGEEFGYVWRDEGHLITGPGGDGSWWRFGGVGDAAGFEMPVRNAAGVAAGRLEVDFTEEGARAWLHRDGVRGEELGYVWQDGHQVMTDQVNGVWSRFDAQGDLAAWRTRATSLHGAADGTAEINLAAQTGNHMHAGGGQRAWNTLAAEEDGVFRLGNAAGDWQRITSDGRIIEESFTLRDARGYLDTTRIHARRDEHGTVTMQLLNADGNSQVPNTSVRWDDNGYRVSHTNTTAHGTDHQVFDLDGTLLSEKIAYLTRKGTSDHTYLQVDHATHTWTRTNAQDVRLAGQAEAQAATARAAQPTPHGYNSGGSVTVKPNGDLQLVGADGTPFYWREHLGPDGAGGHPVLEVFRDEQGGRYWHQWTGADHGQLGAHTARGTRRFEDLPEGRLWKDYRHRTPWDPAVREYRKAADGGIIRAESRPDGSWRWFRYDKSGALTVEGTRDRLSLGRGWQDIPTAPNAGGVAQRYWSAANLFPDALHYREHAVGRAENGGFEATAAYKEFSPQIKDTGTRETVQNNHTLETVRWAEQRPPQFLWKSLGRVDFHTSGQILGDSRYQVFHWTERTANDVRVADGIRAVTPDGSFSDFTRQGDFVRGAVKLENGNTVEIGRDANGAWASLVDNPNPTGARELNWREIDSNKTFAQGGTRYFLPDGRNWVDVQTHEAGNVPVPPQTARYTHADGNVTQIVRPTDRPPFEQAQLQAQPFTPAVTGATITRNTMGQIVSRQERWWADRPPTNGQANPADITVQATGDSRSGDWRWTDEAGRSGIRRSGRNTRWTGAWDDSYQDFHLEPNGQTPIRDLRALDKGRAVFAGRQDDGTWHSEIRDAKGERVGGSTAKREFRHGGQWRERPPAGTDRVRWRDVSTTTGRILRELADGRVRVYVTERPKDLPLGSGEWKEYDQGGVFRERVHKGNDVYRESESFHKQWRETDAGGRLLRFRSLSGAVWERGPVRWSIQHAHFTQVGREFEYRGWASEFRGRNRMWRESNRLQYTATDGLIGTFQSSWVQTAQKISLDFAQDFVMDFTVQALVALAFNNGDLNPQDWYRALLGAGVASGVKGLSGLAHDRPGLGLKGKKDGLANVDSGKDFNRNPYNHDKFWDNDWASTENPTRWRQATYDYFVGTIAVGSLSSFVANAVNAAVFGLPHDYIPLHGGQAALAGGWGAAGSLITGSAFGSIRTFGHLLGSGRYFHKGGVPDLFLQFTERFIERTVGAALLLKATGLRPQDNVPAPESATIHRVLSPTTVLAPLPLPAGAGGDG
ncbi:hypothetical protein [Frankia sp. R82]|uniref:hypothetical protein n=1 Tax=Frankia sp. R82 TaxID=2950553 RepID=UPI0020444AC6|nr:hypothetical protein [Frankia sp. R82]MCM3884409.1 hypothetical protein [Frankia sp. R82]